MTTINSNVNNVIEARKLLEKSKDFAKDTKNMMDDIGYFVDFFKAMSRSFSGNDSFSSKNFLKLSEFTDYIAIKLQPLLKKMENKLVNYALKSLETEERFIQGLNHSNSELDEISSFLNGLDL